MSLFSRLFRRQAPTPAPQPEQAPAAEQPPPPDPAALAAQRAAEEEEALTAAIAAADQAALASLACTGFSTRIRQRAAQAIDDPARLHELIRATRGGKDKQGYRILTAKRDEVLAEQRSAERLVAEIQAASAAIERHTLRPFHALFTPTLEPLERRWRALAPGRAAWCRSSCPQLRPCRGGLRCCCNASTLASGSSKTGRLSASPRSESS